MTREEFGTLAKGMKAVWPDPKFLPDNFAMDVWFGLLKEIPYKEASDAIVDIMRTSKFPPTIADITERVHRAAAGEELSAMEAWGLVRTAISNSNYHAEEMFDWLPKACQKAIGSPENLRELAQLPSETVETVEQSHFVRGYNTVLERQRHDEQANISRFLLEVVHRRHEEMLETRERPRIAVNKDIRSEVAKKVMDDEFLSKIVERVDKIEQGKKEEQEEKE